MAKFQIQRYKTTLTIADGGTTATSSAVELNGLLKGITVVAPALTGSNTLTVAIKDADGTTIYSKASIAESATATAFVDANNHPLQLPLSGNHTITVTSSGTESPAVDVPVVLLIQRG